MAISAHAERQWPAFGIEHGETRLCPDLAEPRQRQVEFGRDAGQVRLRFRWRGEEQFVIVAAGNRLDQASLTRLDDCARRRRERQARRLDHRANPRGLADMAEIRREPVGDVDGGGGQANQLSAQRQPRARQPVAIQESRAVKAPSPSVPET